MGSLAAGVFGPLLPSSSRRSDRHLQRHRSRLWRILRFEKVDYFRWVWIVVVFFFVIALFQSFLPGSTAEKSCSSGNYGRRPALAGPKVVSEAVPVDFGDGIRFHPSKLLEKFRREANGSAGHPRRIAQAASSCVVDGKLGEIIAGDWIRFSAIDMFTDPNYSLLQEPFRSLPLIWSVHEMTVALRSRNYSMDWQIRLNNDWKRTFNRATVVAFPTYYLPMMYSAYDSGNFFFIPGFASEALEAERLFSFNKENSTRDDMGYDRENLVVAVVGSQVLCSELWVEHALVLQSLLPLLSKTPSDTLSSSHFKVGILSGNATSAYKVALEAIALNLGFPQGIVQQIGVDGDFSSFLHAADLVVDGSFIEEQSFPPVFSSGYVFSENYNCT